MGTDMSRDQMLEACVEAIVEKGWKGFSLTDVARQMGRPVSELQREFPTVSDIPQAVITQIDGDMLDAVEGEDFKAVSPREALFEILMARFEAAEHYKDFIRVLWRDWPSDMLSALLIASKGVGSMAWVLDRAGLGGTGLSGMMRIQGLTLLYLYTVKVWLDDDTADLSKTMAALDQGLGRLERIAKALSF